MPAGIRYSESIDIWMFLVGNGIHFLHYAVGCLSGDDAITERFSAVNMMMVLYPPHGTAVICCQRCSTILQEYGSTLFFRYEGKLYIRRTKRRYSRAAKRNFLQ
jgi:hypothetical protein